MEVAAVLASADRMGFKTGEVTDDEALHFYRISQFGCIGFDGWLPADASRGDVLPRP